MIKYDIQTSIGDVIAGRYQITSFLGRGGGGVVYKAVQFGINRPVAIKMLLGDYLLDPTLVRRFEREARLVSRLNHPNTVTVHEFGRDDSGFLYMVMEYVEGVSLKEIIKEADLLWAGVDPLVYNVKSSQYILLRTLREKVPFIAYSSLYVKAGALAAFECDYDDIGRQTARVAIEVIADKKAGSLPVAFPEKRRLIINKNTAKIIGVRIPRKVLEEAEVIF